MSKWTDEAVEKLKEMWVSGKTAREISEELGGFSRNAVIGKANRMGLSTPKSKDESPPPPTPKVESPPQKKAVQRPVRIPSYSKKSREHLCQWPHGEPGKEDFHFCESPSEPGRPYCAKHCEMAYRPCS